MKFDVIMGNPPYGQHGTGDLHMHLNITKSLLNRFNEKMVIIMPNRIVSSTSDKYDKFKESYEQLSSVITVHNTNELFNTSMGTTAIFTFEADKQDSVEVDGVKYKSLFDISNMSDYEKKMMSYLYNEHPNYNAFAPTGENKRGDKETFISKYIKRFQPDKYVCYTSMANGAMNGRFVNERTSKILKVSDLYNDLVNSNCACRVISQFNSQKAAENYMNALKRPLMRFGLIKLQDDQNMTERVYKYIPNIDWEDDTCKTDSGILQMCGFNKADADEFAEYVKDFVENFDNK